MFSTTKSTATSAEPNQTREVWPRWVKKGNEEELSFVFCECFHANVDLVVD